MKIALKVLIVIFALISIGLGGILFLRDGKDAKGAAEIEQLGSVGTGMAESMLGGKMPSASALNTASYMALLCCVVGLALIVVAFIKNPKLIMITSLAFIVLLIISYFIHPAYETGEYGPTDNRGASLIQLIPGVIAGLMGVFLSRKVAAN